MLKIKILILKYYSFCNYKTNLFFFFKKNIFKKNNYFNILNYLVNNLNYKKKKQLSSKLYFSICNKISELNVEKYGIFIFSHINIYLNNILKNYNIKDIIFILKSIKQKKNLDLKNLKKIFTNVLIKLERKIYESLKERFFITIFYTYININKNKFKKALKMYISYNNNNYYKFLKTIIKVCALIYNTQEEYSRKMYLGFLNYDKWNNFPFYLNYIINKLIKKNVFKLNISLDIYNIDLLKIINLINKIKKIKIFLTVNIPDIFFEKIIKNENWFLFDTKNIKNKYNFYPQNFHDEYLGFGSFRNFYKKIIKDKDFFKIKIKAKKILIKILKNNLKINFSDTINRNNINKHISNLLSNFNHCKIFDRNNYFKKKIFYYKNSNIIFQRNNSFYLEIKSKIYFFICKIKKKKFFLTNKLLEIKNEFLIIEKEINFHLNFRTRPFTIILYYNKNLPKEYYYFNIVKLNCFFSKKMNPYCWYPGSELYNLNFFYKNKYLSKNWKKNIFLLENHFVRNSFFMYFKKKKKKKSFISFDNYIIKTIFIKWQKLNEKN